MERTGVLSPWTSTTGAKVALWGENMASAGPESRRFSRVLRRQVILEIVNSKGVFAGQQASPWGWKGI
jgi:hypothetical protein